MWYLFLRISFLNRATPYLHSLEVQIECHMTLASYPGSLIVWGQPHSIREPGYEATRDVLWSKFLHAEIFVNGPLQKSQNFVSRKNFPQSDTSLHVHTSWIMIVLNPFHHVFSLIFFSLVFHPELELSWTLRSSMPLVIESPCCPTWSHMGKCVFACSPAVTGWSYICCFLFNVDTLVHILFLSPLSWSVSHVWLGWDWWSPSELYE